MKCRRSHIAGSGLIFHICKVIYDTLGVIPDFISTYESRKNAFPELVKENDKGKLVRFSKKSGEVIK